MKRLALITLPFFFAAPALAADLDGPRYSEREVIIERAPRVVEKHYHYHRAPVVEYDDDDDTVVYVDRPRVSGFWPRYPEYYGWHRRHHWGSRHHHHRHHHRHHRRH